MKAEPKREIVEENKTESKPDEQKVDGVEEKNGRGNRDNKSQ